MQDAANWTKYPRAACERRGQSRTSYWESRYSKRMFGNRNPHHSRITPPCPKSWMFLLLRFWPTKKRKISMLTPECSQNLPRWSTHTQQATFAMKCFWVFRKHGDECEVLSRPLHHNHVRGALECGPYFDPTWHDATREKKRNMEPHHRQKKNSIHLGRNDAI